VKYVQKLAPEHVLRIQQKLSADDEEEIGTNNWYGRTELSFILIGKKKKKKKIADEKILKSPQEMGSEQHFVPRCDLCGER